MSSRRDRISSSSAEWRCLGSPSEFSECVRFGEVRGLLLEGQRDGTWQPRGETWPAFCFE